MLDSLQLRKLIREKITAGKLPGEPVKQVWAGMGAGRCCDACGEPMKARDTQIEIERLAGRPSVWLHRPCFVVWREECPHL